MVTQKGLLDLSVVEEKDWKGRLLSWGTSEIGGITGVIRRLSHVI